jgi:hypothetical protein
MSEKEASSVLTSENSADFYAKKLGLADAPAVEAVEETPEPSAEESQSEPLVEKEAKPTEERGKQNPKLEKRFSEITRQREEARQEAQKERERSEALEARLVALEGQSKPQAKDENSEPLPEQFQDAFEYAKALARYETERALKERDRQELERKANDERAKVHETWATKVNDAKKEMPDFDDMVASSDVVVTDQIRDAILDSDVGPKILYHLAENPEVAKKLSEMPMISALRELGKLEARFEKTEQKRDPVVRSKAPAPISPIRGATGIAEELSSNGEFTGSYSAWREARRAGRIR